MIDYIGLFDTAPDDSTLIMTQRHPHGNPQNSYYILPLKTVLLWRKTPLPNFTYFILPVSPTCTSDGG
jgi:hypothetical protein